MPTNGIRKIASSQAIAAVGLRRRGMMISANTMIATCATRLRSQIRLARSEPSMRMPVCCDSAEVFRGAPPGCPSAHARAKFGIRHHAG